MYWRISIWLALVIIIGCKSETKKQMVLSEGPLIESDELAALLGRPGLKIIDVRNPEAFEAGHISGAIQIGRKELERTDDSLPGMRADALQMEQLLARNGIRWEDWLVLYDDRGNPEAARLWCILKGYGKERIKLLNGGLKAWEEQGYDLKTEIQVPEPGLFTWQGATPTPLWISADELATMTSDPASNVVLIDTRTHEEYHGVRQKNNATRAGHIPGALHLDWADLIEYHGDHRLKQKEQIRSKLAKFGITERDSVVLYCHSGVRSSLSTFVFREILDYPYVWNYDGSWTEWSRLSNYPIEVDSVTTIFN